VRLGSAATVSVGYLSAVKTSDHWPFGPMICNHFQYNSFSSSESRIRCQLGWVISQCNDRAQTRETEAVTQNGNNNELLKQCSVEDRNRLADIIYIIWTAVSSALKLCNGSWQMLTGRVFHRQTAVRKKVWLYVFVLHGIHLYLVSYPLVWAVVAVGGKQAEIATNHCRSDTE